MAVAGMIVAGLFLAAEVVAVRQTVSTLRSITHEPLYSGFVNEDYTQQFEVKEDNLAGFSWFKKYKFELEQWEDDKGKEMDIDQKVPMLVTPAFFTVKGRMDVKIGDQEFELIKPHITGTNAFGHYSWRVVPKGQHDEVLFTIQKRKFDDDCKVGLFNCKAVWKIYKGRKGDKSTLIYYGIGDSDDQDEPEFKFYHSRDEYKNNKKNWAAKLEHKKHDDSDGEDKFKVKVRPSEDAALILLSVACVDHVADAKREPEEEPEHA